MIFGVEIGYVVLVAVPLAVVGVLWWASAHAPLGWEDESGFHRGDR